MAHDVWPSSAAYSLLGFTAHPTPNGENRGPQMTSAVLSIPFLQHGTQDSPAGLEKSLQCKERGTEREGRRQRPRKLRVGGGKDRSCSEAQVSSLF